MRREIQKRLEAVEPDEILDLCASYNLRRASRLVSQLFDQILQPIGLRSTQVTILLMLNRHGEMAMSRLAKSLSLNPSTLSRNLRPLERESYVRIREGRGRGKTVSLAPKGRRVLGEAAPLWQQAQGTVMSALGLAEFERLRGDLSQLVAALGGVD